MKHIHLIGIGGTGLSAIARVLLESGYVVTGSDRAESPYTRSLRAEGVSIQIGHRAENVAGADLVVRSSAIPDDNLEVVAARLAGIPVQKRADFLGSLMEGRTGIGVAGTHGKTTTTAMIAWLLTALGQDPTFLVGGTLKNLGTNARAGRGKFFVIEADEYDRMFLGLKPALEVITNVEYDHPDCYPSVEDFQAAFIEFTQRLPEDGSLVISGEDAGARLVAQAAERNGREVVSYGIRPGKLEDDLLDVYASRISPDPSGGSTFSAIVLGESVRVNLRIPGLHNVRNALAALAVTRLCGLDMPTSARALGEFRGTGRRFEILGEAGGVTVIDDYAHHPTEIRATLSAARSCYPSRRIWTVWQPHTYSRTRALFPEFVDSFADADQVIVTEIFAAREPQQDYSAEQLVRAMSHPAVRFIPDLPSVRDYLSTHLAPGDVLLVLSAGDADAVSAQVLARLKEA
jgi:UDP-N-acetylmuramate--alanine ligase